MSSAFQSLPARVANLNASEILEIAELAQNTPDSIHLYAGESDSPTPGFIVAAANQALVDGQTRYALSRGVVPLREAIARYLSRTYAVPMGIDRITVTVGGMQAIALALMACLEPGDEIVVPVPVWPNIIETALAQGAVVSPLEMVFDADSGWQLDVEQLMASVTPRTKAIFINSPGNPTGVVASAGDIARLMQFCREHQLWVIADEVYGRMIYPARAGTSAPSFLSVAEPEDRVIVTNTMSKNWSMTGWRVGWAVHPPSLGQTFANLVEYASTSTATFAQYAAIVALDEGDAHIDQMVSQCEVGRNIICDALASVPGVTVIRPHGAFYVFFKVDGLTDSRQLALSILDRAGVGMAPGSAFHRSGEGWMRLCFGVSHATLNEASERLVRYLSDPSNR